MELTEISAAKLAELMRTRACSPVEVVEAYLKRIDELNPQLNAIVTLAQDAVERAREAEAALMRGDEIGPLCGLPFTVKDTIETRGLRTTSGSLVRAEFVPKEDAAAVARLKSAGAILLGKTNPSEMALNYDAENPVFGRTNNPYDLSRTSGGSSGGEAAAISACLSPAGLGSDLMGSVRVPAHFCGIAGLKPTPRRVASAGHFPEINGLFSLGAVIGPMARRVEDLALLLQSLSAHEVKAEQERDEITLRGARVAWYADDGVAPVTEETRAAVEMAAHALAEAGFQVFESRPPGVEQAQDLWSRLFARAALIQLQKAYSGEEEKAGEFARFLLESGKRRLQESDSSLDGQMERDELRLELSAWMRETPFLLAPVYAAPAFKHDARKIEVGDELISLFRAGSYSQAFNVFGLPAVSVPVTRTREGLPVGVQIVGRLFEEESILKVASVIEEAFGGWSLPRVCREED